MSGGDNWTPYREAARWRHRFYFSLMILAGMAVLVLSLLWKG